MFNKQAWDKLSDHQRELLKLAGKVSSLDSWSRYAYNDISALAEMKANGNEFVKLSPEFIKAAKAAAAKWSDEQAAQNPWFKRALDHRRAFQDDITAHWSSFRFPIGAQ